MKTKIICNVNAFSLQNYLHQPTDNIDYYNIQSDWRDRFEYALSILIHKNTIFTKVLIFSVLAIRLVQEWVHLTSKFIFFHTF